jgi:ribosomal protein S19E (S16A)
MLSRPGEFNPNNIGISLLPAMMSDYGQKKKNNLSSWKQSKGSQEIMRSIASQIM